MKPKYTLHERIAVRAYYLWLNGSTRGDAYDWHRAEGEEFARQDDRRIAARKSAATKRDTNALRQLARIPIGPINVDAVKRMYAALDKA